jgi:Cd2+/Zn2+-exporting ATPase
VQQPDGTWREVGAKQIAIGSRVRVKPGERIALDGEVLEGRSAVNQAPITGESLPVEKSPGDPVFAGTINESGSFEYRVTAVASNSTLARIIHAVEAAQGSRAPTQRFVDQFARWYTPIVFALPSPSHCCHRCSWVRHGWTGFTVHWFCWWSPARAHW